MQGLVAAFSTRLAEESIPIPGGGGKGEEFLIARGESVDIVTAAREEDLELGHDDRRRKKGREGLSNLLTGARFPIPPAEDPVA